MRKSFVFETLNLIFLKDLIHSVLASSSFLLPLPTHPGAPLDNNSLIQAGFWKMRKCISLAAIPPPYLEAAATANRFRFQNPAFKYRP